MPIPILTSKLHIPSSHSSLVPRPRLIKRLGAGLHGKLTLVSAPAGFGKTTLLSTWVADVGLPVAWLSLDDRDSDPLHFMSYIVTALQTINTGIGQVAINALQASQVPSTESILTSLLNDITAVTDAFLLVLDDYHMLDSLEVDDTLAFLVDHLPPQMHLVIATREDPQLPLARLRVRNQLNEVRVTDLRFTADEAADFLNRVMGLTLTAQDIDALEQRTEGWIAGLQLAALTLQARTDTTHLRVAIVLLWII